MVRGKKPVRGGKRKLDKHQSKPPKQKKGKFNFREASYVKDRDAKNAEIENRRKRLEEEEIRKKKYQRESDDDDNDDEIIEDPMKILLSTFTHNNALAKTAIVSESESENSSDHEEENTSTTNDVTTCSNKEISDDNNISLNDEVSCHSENDEETIKILMKEDDEEDDETAREDAGILHDPFSIHLNNDLSKEMYSIVSSVKSSTETHNLTWPNLGRIIVQIPKSENDTDIDSKINKKTKATTILENKQYTMPGKIPKIIDKVDWDKLYVKCQIQNNLTRANYSNIKDNLDSKNPSAMTPLQKELFSIINNYQDLLYCERTFTNEDEIRFVYCLHAINHLLKTRTKILHHNAKLSKSNKVSMGEVPDEYRDQGLVRPKILIVVPFRHSCLKIVDILIAILIGEDKGGSVVNKKRFYEDFGGDTISMPKKNPKPEDYELTFKGNTDDSFKIGISITKKTLKLYSEFYSSDIIITSVLGLRMLVGAEGEEDRDYDFLASIELLIMDQTEIFFMQNWDHLIHVLNHMHLQPKNSHDTDFGRVRSWCVNGWSKYYRQTLIFSSIQLPEIHGIFNKQCHNYAGKVRISNIISSGSVCQVAVQLPQLFQKFNASSHKDAIELRFEYFITKILPQYRDTIMNHTLIFIPSYYDYVKLRNYFKKEEINFVQICEYSKYAKVARARDMFFHSDAHFLLYSERFHFFRRVRIKGIRHILFYAPPTMPHFYSEMCNLMHESNQNPRAGSESNMTVTTLYSKYDAMHLAAIVGTERANQMIVSSKNMHMLMTGE
ncbi:hypothetical protein PV325_011059 [Microctonus aethiopoides]|nr:hypothetical protein PV325_011059 [Microctonus aethiopoides]